MENTAEPAGWKTIYTEKVLCALADWLTAAPQPAEQVPDRGWLKKFCTSFFYWWHNQPGANTQQGFDSWMNTEEAAKLFRLAAEDMAQSGGRTNVKG